MVIAGENVSQSLKKSAMIKMPLECGIVMHICILFVNPLSLRLKLVSFALT